MRPLSWPNTVQLTISIQRSSEIILLFKYNALSAIEYLNITIENMNTDLAFNTDISAMDIQLSEDSLRQTAVVSTHLKHLLLRYITLNDAIILIGSSIMPVLEELILINMYDNESYMRDLNEEKFIPKILFVIYNCPINLLYRHKRAFHNYGFATHASAPIRTIRRRSIQWICDQKYEAEQFNKTLQIIASGRVNELRLTYLYERTNTLIMSECKSHWNLSLNHIRSITFNIQSDSIQQCERIAMIEQILDASPNLSSLVIAWRDFQHCSQKYLNLKHLHLLLNGRFKNPKNYFDIHRLNELVPHLYTLETSDSVMMLNEKLIEFILNISHQFNQLVYLVLNKKCLNRSSSKKKLEFSDKLIAASHDQIFHGYNMHFQFYGYDELRIWF
ncbi:unnamed protein product [Adineta steineri]|uniref:Uncharacterized protein n=1 Tax=Adineta steineri TaxID=433720 RepID=A0A819CYK6_9BILA|nr:unnamed protein product [Adineta steineri]CAF3819525.1 unnamed protein product [Adineta steineri]